MIASTSRSQPGPARSPVKSDVEVIAFLIACLTFTSASIISLSIKLFG